MATTTTIHAQLIRYTTSGDQIIVNLKTTGSDVSITRSNSNLPTTVTTAQTLANALGSLAFKSSLNKSDVGLGSVDNTADANKSVKYATSAGSAGTVSFGTLSSNNLNDLQSEGRLYYAAGSNTCSNTPVASGTAFELYVGRNASGYRYQRLTTLEGEIYIRRFDSNAWGSWRKLAFTSDTVAAASSVAWGNVTGKPSSYTPASHTHNYAGSGSAGGSANSAVKLDTATAGSATQPVYFTGGKPAACSYTLGKSVPSNAVFTDTTYSVFKGASSSAAGGTGLVPAPATGNTGQYLRGDGTWATPTNTTYGVATTSANGLMTAAMVTKLNGIATGANAYSHPGYTARAAGFYKVTVDGSGHVSNVAAVTKEDITALGIPGSDTNTWRGIQNNLTSSSTTDSLSAYQGMVLNQSKLHRDEWNCTLKCATWSRLCYVGAKSSITGSAFLLNVYTTRNSVVYNNTFMIKAHHSSAGCITKISGCTYGSVTSIRLITNGNGDCYVEYYDNANGATNTTTQSVNCTLIRISVGTPTFYTSFTDGSTLPSGFSKAAEMSVNGNSLQGNLTWGEITGKPGSMPASDVYSWAKASTKPSYSWSEITGKPSTFTPASHTHSSVTDIGNSSTTTFAYSKAGLGYGDYTWLAGWNGYELRAVAKSQFATAGHGHSAATSSAAGFMSAADKAKFDFGDIVYVSKTTPTRQCIWVKLD